MKFEDKLESIIQDQEQHIRDLKNKLNRSWEDNPELEEDIVEAAAQLKRLRMYRLDILKRESSKPNI